MSKSFIRIRPENDPKAPGWRFRLQRDEGDMAVLASERVFPERVTDPEANLVEPADCFWMKRDDAEWLRDQLTEMLNEWPSEPS